MLISCPPRLDSWLLPPAAKKFENMQNSHQLPRIRICRPHPGLPANSSARISSGKAASSCCSLKSDILYFIIFIVRLGIRQCDEVQKTGDCCCMAVASESRQVRQKALHLPLCEPTLAPLRFPCQKLFCIVCTKPSYRGWTFSDASNAFSAASVVQLSCADHACLSCFVERALQASLSITSHIADITRCRMQAWCRPVLNPPGRRQQENLAHVPLPDQHTSRVKQRIC